jgi:thioesterase domain-containing protein
MNTREFLQELLVQDIRVWADGDRLRVNAPHDVLTAELRSELAARKIEIWSFLEALAMKRSSLVPLQPAGSRPAFYGVPADGDVFSYLQLSRQLGPDQPFYAFEAPGIDGAQPPLTSIEALAACYLADLRAFQPDGPYFIGGFCLGGIVAFELARQLCAQGQDVALLALFESPSPNGLNSSYRLAGRFRRRRSEIFERVRNLSGQPWPERLAFVQSRLARVLRGRDPVATAEPARGWREQQTDRVFRATLEAAYAYVLEDRTYPGRIVLFQGSQELKRRRAYLRQLDWARVAAGGLEVNVGLDGCSDYMMMLLDPPHVRALADLLKPYLGHPPRRSPAPS